MTLIPSKSRCLAMVVGAAAAFIAACSVYTSRPMAPTTCASKAQHGIHYALPLRMVTLAVDEHSVITMSEYVSVPDPAYHYVLKYNTNPLTSDELTVTCTPEGFLSTVNTQVTDVTPAIIVKLVDAIARISVGLPPKAAGRDETPARTPFSMSIDPTRKEDRDAFSAALTAYGHSSVDLECALDSLPTSACPPASREVCGANGIFYRPLLLYRLNFKRGGTPLGTIPLLLTQGAPLLCYEVTRGAFIKKKVDLTFDKGLLTTVVINKPSEIAGLVDIPIDIARALLSLPSELLTFRIEHVTNETKYLENLKALIEAQRALKAVESQPTGGAKG